METVQKIVNNLIFENIYSLKGQLIKTGRVIFEDKQFMSKQISQKSFKILISIWLVTLLLNGYNIMSQYNKYLVFNV